MLMYICLIITLQIYSNYLRKIHGDVHARNHAPIIML